MKTIWIILAVAVLGLQAGLASASYSFISGDMNLEYGSGEIIKGVFVMNFTNHSNAIFTTNYGGNISLLELLKKENYIANNDYSCIPGNCKVGYKSNNPLTSKEITLNNEEKLFGLAVTGNNEIDIQDFSFKVKSDIANACLNQFSLDLFDDGIRDFYNNNYVDEICGNKRYGCFDSSSNTVEATIGSSLYCEQITLPAAPAYRIGAKIRNNTSGGTLTMELYDPDKSTSEYRGRCTLPKHSTETQELDCIVNYSANKEFDAFVCIYGETGSNYKIRTENTNVCGMLGVNPEDEFQIDYEIYAANLKYGGVESTFNEASYGKLNSDASLNDKIQEYIDNTYQGKCSPECIIPVSINGPSQKVTIDTASITYDASGGTGFNSDKIYDLTSEDVKINVNELEFKIENLGAITPNRTALEKFYLYLDEQKIFNQTIEITSTSTFDIAPKQVAIGRNTEFSIISSVNVTSSVWKFGDNGAATTSLNNKATHKYDSTGNYEVEVFVKFSNGKNSTRKFNVNVGNAKESANDTIKLYTIRIANLSRQIQAYPSWMRSEIEEQIDIAELNASLENIKKDFNNSTNESEYVAIVSRLSTLDVPYSITRSQFGKVPLSVGYANIETNYIEMLYEEEVDDDEQLRKNIVGWMEANYDVEVDYEIISLFSDEGKSDLITKFKITVNPKESATESVDLIIDRPLEGITFAQAYGQKEIGAATAIPISDSSTIEFVLPENVDVEELGAYLAPDIATLGVIDGEVRPYEEPPFNTKVFIIWIVVLIIIFIIVYIAIQEWYKRNYERHLFKNPRDLYNLINFIYNSRVSGLSDREIKSKLSQSGWKGEQITYAFKKIDGKRTGMYEIPLFKFVENKRVRKEIEMRHPGQEIDTRFIKRPEFDRI